jgi:hypothetical protein
VLWDQGEYAEVGPLEATYRGRDPQWVRTAPPFDTPTTLRMWALGDMGTGYHEQSMVRNVAERFMAAEGRAPDMFLALGGESPAPAGASLALLVGLGVHGNPLQRPFRPARPPPTPPPHTRTAEAW